MGFKVTFEGVDEVIRELEKYGDTGRLSSAMGECCAIVERDAKQKAPKDTGALRRSIKSRVETGGGNVEGIVYTPLEYAPYVEFGTGLFAENGGRKDVPWLYRDDEGKTHITSGQKPQPYMRPALKENRQKVLSKLAKELFKK